jgi:hypothetical protein
VYADVLGTAYEYPRRYRNLISPGELFVHYRGRRKLGGGQQRQVYLGCGTIGAVSSTESDRLTCQLEDYKSFPEPLFFKADGDYLEPGGARNGYFQPGVRRIRYETFQSIVTRGLGTELYPADELAPARYASALDAQRIEEVSRRATREMLTARPDTLTVEEMALNNPGYDLLASGDDGLLYVEVKGTRGVRPRFFMSEGERLFAERESGRYLLVVVTQVDLSSGAWGAIHTLSDIPDRSSAGLREHQWRGELPNAWQVHSDETS